MSELKPCSACGSEPECKGVGECDCSDFSYETNNAFFGCSNKQCSNYDTEMSEDEWNTRPIEDALRAENEALKAKVAELEKALPSCYLETQTGLPKYVAKLEADNARMRGAFRTIVEGFDVIDSLSIAKNILKEVSK